MFLPLEHKTHLFFYSSIWSERAGILNPRFWLAIHALVTGPAFYDTAHEPDLFPRSTLYLNSEGGSENFRDPYGGSVKIIGGGGETSKICILQNPQEEGGGGGGLLKKFNR